MKPNITFSSILLTIAFLYAGCSSTTSPGTTTVVVPKQGSIFIAYHSSKDSTGNIVSPDTERQTVANTGLTIYGKMNVVESIQSQDGVALDTVYFHYETNGDVSVYAAYIGWLTAPFSSQTTTVHAVDTTIQGTHLVGSITLKGTGSGIISTISIKDKSFSTEKVSVTESLDAGGYSTVTSTAISFAPALGWIVLEDDAATRDPFSGALGTSSHIQVIDYTLY